MKLQTRRSFNTSAEYMRKLQVEGISEAVRQRHSDATAHDDLSQRQNYNDYKPYLRVSIKK